MGAYLLLYQIKFMVDLQHCDRHKETTYMPWGNPCLPSALVEVKGVNTECAEQVAHF